jgi:hypothetical protein
VISVRALLWSGLALLLGSAAWLYAERGPAMLLDMATASASWFCM